MWKRLLPAPRGPDVPAVAPGSEGASRPFGPVRSGFPPVRGSSSSRVGGSSEMLPRAGVWVLSHASGPVQTRSQTRSLILVEMWTARPKGCRRTQTEPGFLLRL